MTKENGMGRMIPVFITALVGYLYYVGMVPLGYMYNTYPGQETIVMTIALIPIFVAALVGVFAGKLMETMGRKRVIIVSMIIMLIGGIGMFLMGDKGIGLALFFSAIGGVGGGTVISADYATLAAIAPENVQDKVFGWCDAVCSLGLAIGMTVCGILSAGSRWTYGYGVYFILIPIILITIVGYPSDKDTASAEVKAETGADEEVPSGKVVIAKSLLILLVIKVIMGMFNGSYGVFFSDYIINDLQAGSSALVGANMTLTQIVGIAVSAFIFVWLKTMKGFSTLISQIIIGATLIVLIKVGAVIPAIYVCSAIFQFGIVSSHSSLSTVLSLAPEKNAVGRVAGLLLAATFAGEAVSGYVAPIFASLIKGSATAAACMETSGILAIVLGVISFPFFMKAYKMAYNKEEKQEV